MRHFDNLMSENMRGRKYVGDVGIEIEVECKDPLPFVENQDWLTVADNSLRGFSFEYRLTRPVPYEAVNAKLLYLSKKLKGLNLDMSNRTSVHVHLNVQRDTVLDVIKFQTLYYLLEDVMLLYVGEHRRNNLFCLPARLSEGVFDVIATNLVKQQYLQGIPEDYRYSALNVASLYKFGSLEFRALEGTIDPVRIMGWVNTLKHVYDRAKMFKNPSDIVDQCFQQTGSQFVSQNLPENFEGTYCKGHNVDHMVSDNIGNLLEIAYGQDWTRKKPPPPAVVQVDPPMIYAPDHHGGGPVPAAVWADEVQPAEVIRPMPEPAPGWVAIRDNEPEEDDRNDGDF